MSSILKNLMKMLLIGFSVIMVYLLIRSLPYLIIVGAIIWVVVFISNKVRQRNIYKDKKEDKLHDSGDDTIFEFNDKTVVDVEYEEVNKNGEDDYYKDLK